MYLSHPVRRMREDPVEGESVTLLVTAVDEDGIDELAGRLGEVGTVEDRLRFGTVEVTVSQEAVAEVCQLPRPDARLRSRLRTGLVRGLPVCRPGWVVGCVVPVPVQRPGLKGELTVTVVDADGDESRPVTISE